MILTNPRIGQIKTEELTVSPRELSARLMVPEGYENELIYTAEKAVKEVTNCRFCAVKVPLSINEAVDFGFMKVDSRSLAKNLSGCREAFVFAVTLGQKVDRLLSRLSKESVTEHFFADAVASALAQAAFDAVERIIKENRLCKPSFSPGYGDVPLEIQPEILKVCGAEQIGISLSPEHLMTPQKSITAIMGIIQ